MAHHRFREVLETPANPTPSASDAFVAWPLIATAPAVQLSSVQEIYRLAAEQTRRQLEPFRLPGFSRN